MRSADAATRRRTASFGNRSRGRDAERLRLLLAPEMRILLCEEPAIRGASA